MLLGPDEWAGQLNDIVDSETGKQGSRGLWGHKTQLGGHRKHTPRRDD